MTSLFVFCVILGVCSFASVNAKLQIGIYYESLCPDSQNFMQFQLDSAYEKIKDDVEITFVPFGKAHSNNGGESFTCQHGPEECEINKLQACAINVIANDESSQDRIVEYVICQMGVYADPSGEWCVEQAGADFAKVQECTRTEWGKQLMLRHEMYTKQISPEFVPTIVYNGVFDQSLQDASLEDFYETVQSLL